MARRGPVAWVVDLNASPDDLFKQADALERDARPNHFLLPGFQKGQVPPQRLRNVPRPSRPTRPQKKPELGIRCGLPDVVNCPQLLIEVLCCTGISHVGRLATLRKDFRDFFRSDDAWHVMCFVLASQSQLYAPRSYALGWQRLFWDQLWPARQKWFASDVSKSDFGIRVGVRFRPATQTNAPADGIASNELFLPLHQRLRLCRAGKLDWEQLLDAEGGNAGLVEALSAQGELPAEMIEAILSAQHLKAQAAEARAQARGAAVRRGHGEEDASDANQQNVAADDQDAGASSNVDASALPNPEGSNVGGDNKSSDKKEDDQTTRETSEDAGTSRERRGGNAHVLTVQPSRVMMYVPGQGARPFQYARVIGEEHSQETVYAELGHDMICAMLNGFNACLFCYGQTGSGKTHTLFGPDGCLDDALAGYERLSPSLGVALRALHEVFEESSGLQQQRGLTVRVTCQYVQIYNEQVTDLLSGAKVQIRGPRAELHGSAEVSVNSFAGAVEMLRRGQERKHVAETAMNERSSRAHTIFVLNLTQINNALGATAKSTLHLVDLAGCEQLKQSKATGTRQQEAIGINSSLLVLGKVITALVEGKSHVPYYESALTQLLRPALGGNSRTTVVVTCSSDKVHGDQTLHALRFGERCQQVVNSAALDTVTNVSDALRTIDEALRTCEEALTKQRERGLTHLPAHQRLREKHLQLQQTRKTLEEPK